MNNEGNMYNLTFPQQNIWQLNMVSENTPINIIAGSLNIHKGFDKKRANDTVNEFVKLNEGLRLRLKLESGKIYQYVSDYTEFVAEYIDASIYSKEQLEELKRQIISKPMQIIDNNLFEYTLIDLGNSSGEIFLKAHHIIADAWSTAKMCSQLSYIYEKLSGNLEKSEFISASYVDFILSEREYVGLDKYVKDGQFWKSYLAGYTNLVGFNKPISSENFDARRYEYKLSDSLNNKISEYCKQNRFSPYIVFMAAFGIYLSYINDVQDLVIGTPVLNRSNFKEKTMQGMCISTIPVRIKLTDNSTFYTVCKSIAKDSFDTFKHQKYPYSQIASEYKEETGNTDNLFKTMLSYQNARADFAALDKYSMTWTFQGAIEEDLDLHIQDLNNSGKLVLNVDYKTELFTEYEIELFVKRIENIILNGMEKLDESVYKLKIISDEEENIILPSKIGEDTEYPKDKSLIELFLLEKAKNPDKVALVYNGQEVTYNDLDLRAKQIQSLLHNYNVKCQDAIGIMQNKGIDIVASILAILRAGGKYVPMDKKSANDLNDYIISNANVKLVITDETSLDISVPFVSLPLAWDEADLIHCNAIYTAPDDVVNIMYTSGTTGRPKGVEITNQNIIRLVKNSNYITLSAEDIMTQTGSYTFDASTLEIWNGLLNSVPLHILNTSELAPDYFSKYIKENNVTVIFLTTALFNQMIEYDASMFEKVRVVMTGGEAMSQNHVKKLKKACSNLKVLNLYGPTENSVVSTYYEVLGTEDIIPIGKPLSNTTCFVLNNKLLEQPLYTIGMLYVGGDGVAKGYINNEEKTMQSFVNGMYCTGDLVYIDENSNINFIGRKDKEVKIKGVRVDLKAARQKLLELNGVKNCEFVVVTDSDNTASKYLVVFYVSEDGLLDRDVLEYTKSFMPYLVTPKRAIKLDKIPLTINGKVDTKALLKINQDYVGTRTFKMEDIPEYIGVYKSLYEVFAKVLKDKYIMPTDNFFDIGGDSLLGIQVVTECMAKDIQLTYGELFKYKTIKDIGDVLDKKRVKAEISAGIEQYDYTKLHQLISLNNLDNIKNIKTQTLGDVILTGVTGFLGAHTLYELIMNTTSTVFCPIRLKNGMDVTVRLRGILKFYFGDVLDKFIGNRIVPFVCDLTCEENELIQLLNERKHNITHLINSAAIVKHYGDLEKFKKVNVESVKYLCNICINSGIELIHVSTGSVSGDIVENGQEIDQDTKGEVVKKTFTETDLYIGQQLDNVYAYTKFLAERYILEKVLENNLKAKILRMGNLSHRYSDSVFQINPQDNAFLMRLKSLVSLGVLPEGIKEYYLDFTPVDMAARALINICSIENKEYNIYHVYNPNKVKIIELVNAFEKHGVSMIFATDEQIKSRITKMANTSAINLKGIVVDLTEDKKLNYVTDVDVKLEYTAKVLETLGFNWPKIDNEYLKRYIEYLLSTKGE